MDLENISYVRSKEVYFCGAFGEEVAARAKEIKTSLEALNRREAESVVGIGEHCYEHADMEVSVD